jgi:pimeloyl-ACP methyl ester carboxylesterase
VYAIVVGLVFHLRVVFSEEPYLRDAHPRDWNKYKTEVPRWIFRSRGAWVGSLVAILIALPLAGLVYEAYAEGKAARDFPAPGMLVDIGGRRLHLLCIGEGAPIVFFEGSGFGVPSTGAAQAREAVAKRTRVCSYDRMGMGWSDPGPRVVSAGDLARDLAVLQDRAQLPAPFVLVASSVGGLTVEMFARRYPERAAGLVFLDAASSGALKNVEGWFGTARLFGPLFVAAGRLGLVRLADPFAIPRDTDEGRRSAAMTYGAEPIATITAITRGLETTAREFAEAPPLRADVPLAVLSASDPNVSAPPGLGGLADALRANRVERHKQLASSSSKGTWQMVPKSTHLLASTQPEVVAEAVFAILEAAR